MHHTFSSLNTVSSIANYLCIFSYNYLTYHSLVSYEYISNSKNLGTRLDYPNAWRISHNMQTIDWQLTMAAADTATRLIDAYNSVFTNTYSGF